MKDRIIEVAGKIWRVLGARGEINITDLAKLLREKDEVVFQALGWLAREDKINYRADSRKTLISLVESELSLFNSQIKSFNQQLIRR